MKQQYADPSGDYLAAEMLKAIEAMNSDAKQQTEAAGPAAAISEPHVGDL